MIVATIMRMASVRSRHWVINLNRRRINRRWRIHRACDIDRRWRVDRSCPINYRRRGIDAHRGRWSGRVISVSPATVSIVIIGSDDHPGGGTDGATNDGAIAAADLVADHRAKAAADHSTQHRTVGSGSACRKQAQR